jgi:glutathione S-transferase
MVLYNSAVSGNCYKVRLLLAHLGVEYETVELSVVDRSNRKDVLGELNPGLRVPTLVLDDGRPLAESDAILWYFADGTQFLPDDPYERAQVLQWMFFESFGFDSQNPKEAQDERQEQEGRGVRPREPRGSARQLPVAG